MMHDYEYALFWSQTYKSYTDLQLHTRVKSVVDMYIDSEVKEIHLDLLFQELQRRL